MSKGILNASNDHPLAVLIALIGVLLATFTLSLCLGSGYVSPATVIDSFSGNADPALNIAIVSFRTPRVLLAALVGMTLGLSGVLLQRVLRNDLAEPGLLGVSSGANLAVTCVLIVMGVSAVAPWLLPSACVAGALANVLFVCAIGYRSGAITSSRLLLAGIAVSAAVSALTLILAMRIDRVIHSQAVSWMTGNLSRADWNYVAMQFVIVCVAGPIVYATNKELDLLQLNDDATTGVGMRTQWWRFTLLLLAVVIGACGMATSGSIPFVGLISPHAARLLVGRQHRWLIPASCMVGAVALVLSDLVGRIVFQPHEIPAGIIVTALGGGYFIGLLVTSNHRSS